MVVRYSSANSKIVKLNKVQSLKRFLSNGRKVYSFDLLSGHSCPFAHRCASKAVQGPDGKRTIQDGEYTEFRCFSASQEVQYTGVFNLRSANFDALRTAKTVDGMYGLIQSALPKDAGIVRIHVAGDFFNIHYFMAWLKVIANNPHILFYAYTKSLPYWIQCREEVESLSNFVLTASDGGRHDSLIAFHGLRTAIVAFSESEVESSGLELDDDDSHAADPSKRDQSFCLLIHGTQPKGSEAANALSNLKRKVVLV